MNQDRPADIIIKLNGILTEEMSLHAISFKFDQLAQEIKTLDLSFRVVPTIEFYQNDEELTFLHNQEKKLMAQGNLTLAIEAREKKRQLLKLKEGSESAKLNSEPSIFKFESGIIVARLNKTILAQRLLVNLIDGYNLRSSK